MNEAENIRAHITYMQTETENFFNVQSLRLIANLSDPVSST